ncbi:MAG: ATP-binding protein [Candidatus Woesearchaeota archaeon]
MKLAQLVEATFRQAVAAERNAGFGLSSGFELLDNVKDMSKPRRKCKGQRKSVWGESAEKMFQRHALESTEALVSENFNAQLKLYAELKKLPFQHLDSVAEEDYFSALSLYLLHNDLSDLLHSSAEDRILHRGRKNFRKREVWLQNREMFLNYENSRLFLHLVPYIAAGSKGFLIPVQAQSLPSLLEAAVRASKCNATQTTFCDCNGAETLMSDEYFALLQLVKNAGRFLPENGYIKVSVTENDHSHVLAVEDNGTGIPEDKLPRIFFGYSTRDRGGVGLQFVHRIAELRNGVIEVVSTQTGKETFKYSPQTSKVERIAENKPQGTTFMLHLPKLS